MSLRNRIVLPVILFALAVLAGCGGSSSSNPVPPPSGAYSNTNFNGTYTFSVLGEDVGTGSGSPFAMSGSLTACGCSAGTISAGTVDLIDDTGIASAAAIGSNSVYSISQDGRGFGKLFITPTGGTAFEVDVDFVLTSSSHGLITRFDGNGTGSGTIDLQSAAVAQSSLASTPYVVSLAGTDLAGDPLISSGAFTLDSTGAITTGVADTTLYSFAILQATPYANSALSGSVLVGSGTTPGTATLGTSFGTLSFDVYTIDATHLKLVENDGFEILVGDVFTQPSATIPAGNLVFSMAGPDLGGTPFVAGGIMASDGASAITSGSEDLNDGGQIDFGTNPAVPQTFSGSFTATGGGRFQVTLATFDGGTSFAAYPSSNGILLQEIDAGAGSGATSGVALLQSSGAAIAASQGYGMDLSGVDVFNGPEVDEIAEFNATTTALTGFVDENDLTISLGTGNLTGAYTPLSNGTGSATFNTGLAGMFYYAADNSTALFISTDSSVVGLGSIEAQSAPTQSALEKSSTLPMLRLMSHLHSTSARGAKRFVRKHQ
jgi:hypothetical protein